MQKFNDGDSYKLSQWLTNNGIQYHLSAEFASDLREFGYSPAISDSKDFLSKYVILIEEHELTALQLSISGVTIIENRKSIRIKNKIREIFSWMLK